MRRGLFAFAQSVLIGWASVFLGLSLGAQHTNQPSPIDLPTAMQLAGARNLEIEIARERLKEAEAERTSAVERFFPWITPGITYHRRDGVAQAVPSGNISDAHFQSYSPGASITAQVDLGDAYYRNLAAKQLVNASSHALETHRQEAITAAAKGYFDLSKARGLVEVAAAALKTSQDYQRELHEAVGVGIAFRGDELRVETQTRQFEIELRQAQQQQRLAAVELARILHLDSRVELVPEDAGQIRITLFPNQGALDSLVAEALRSRPELRESEALVNAARQDNKGAVYGPLVPSLNAQVFGGGLGGGPDGGPSHFGAEGDYLVGMSWRIGPGGLFDVGRVRKSKARLSATELAGTKLRDDIVAQVVSSLTRIQSLSDQTALAEARISSATQAISLMRDRKQYGVGIVLEAIQAQQDLDRARAEYVRLLADYNKAQYDLSRAVGSIPLTDQAKQQH